ECAYQLHNLADADHYFQMASRNGFVSKYFDYFRLNFNDTKCQGKSFIETIQSNYKQIIDSIKDTNYIDLESRILLMIQRDQGIRQEFMAVRNSQDESLKDSLLRRMHYIDSLNQ